MAKRMSDANLMGSSGTHELELFFSRPNRSLSKNGRTLWVLLIASSASLIATAAAATGAWLVLPFAGLDVALVWIAFRCIGRHDADYEVLSLRGHEFRWEQRHGDSLDELGGSLHWATIVRCDTDRGYEIRLEYGGKSVELGKLMTPRQREKLDVDLGQVFRRKSRFR
jgi:uncharacterized membrane protein